MWPLNKLRAYDGQYVRCAELYRMYHDDGGTMTLQRFTAEVRKRFPVDAHGVIRDHILLGSAPRKAFAWAELVRMRPETPPYFLIGKRTRGCRGGEVEPDVLAIDIYTARKMALRSPRFRSILLELGVGV